MNPRMGTARNERLTDAVRQATRVLDRPAATASIGASLAALVEYADATGSREKSVDVYGDGIVGDLEQRVADLLGTEDAAFFPTGTMAQQVALRCWAQRSSRPTVALHALAHPQVHESDALFRVSDLQPVIVTSEPRPIVAADLRTLREPVGTLMLELPLRDAGFVLPTWDELVEVTSAAHEQGAVVHLDGARLWECVTHFGRDLTQISALADSVYVSFYKSLRGLSGAALAGPTDVIEQARLWRHRYGGTLFQQFPAVLAALNGLQHNLLRLPTYVTQAHLVAHALAQELTAAGIAWSAVHPQTPHTHQFQVWLPYPARVLTEAGTRHAEQTGTALFAQRWREPGLPPGIAVTEVTVGEPALQWSAQDVRTALRKFLDVVNSVVAEGAHGL